MSRPDSPGVPATTAPVGRTDEDAFRLELDDFAGRIAAYMTTRDPPLVNPTDIAIEAVHLVFEDAFFETYPLVKRRMELSGRD